MLSWDDRIMVIGEVGQAHDGSLGTAHAFIDAIAGAGADAVKFQTHIAAAESRVDEPGGSASAMRTTPAISTGSAWSSPPQRGKGCDVTPRSGGWSS